MKQETMKLDWKWKRLAILWLIVFWVAPSYRIHNFGMIQTPPPGSDLPPPPVFQPFGAVYIVNEIINQLTKVSFGDAFSMFLFHMLPFVLYTFLISVVLYLVFLFLKSLFIQPSQL